MTHASLLLRLLLAALILAAPAAAQKLARKAFEDPVHGYSFKHPEDFATVPPQPQEAELGVVLKLAGAPLAVKKGDFSVKPEAVVLRFAEQAVRGKEKEGGTVSETKVRDDLGEYLERYKAFDKDKPTVDEQVRVRKLTARHRTWRAQAGMGIPLVIDAWSFPLSDADVHLVYFVPDEHEKKWIKCFEKSAKTFMVIGREGDGPGLSSGASYEELFAFHVADAERTPGWTALPTPSKKFILKTNSTNRNFLDEVIQRLEKSRELYERDFPPPASFDAVSIVRVCATEEEFHLYGGTGAGVAGWFNPVTTELVLYDAVDVDRNQSYAVMSHEAFHQYCHYLFERSEAHRWFDEGHGDYYGGVEFKAGKATITPKMPGGLNRLDVIKEMVRARTFQPIRKHIHFDHQQWQTQGPSNVSCYAQSWSIVYMLRQGALGHVPKKCWKPEYAQIIPAYVEALHAGFRAAFDEIRAEREQAAEEEERELTEEELDIDRFDLPPGRKEEIWEQAMDASWGAIDVDIFEKDWIAFVEDVL